MKRKINNRLSLYDENMNLNYAEYDHGSPENRRIEKSIPPLNGFRQSNYMSVRNPIDFLLALEMNYYEEHGYGIAIVDNEHIIMDIYGHGKDGKATPLAVIEALEEQLYSYYSSGLFIDPAYNSKMFSVFVNIPRFILFAVGTYNLYFIDQGLHYLAHHYLKDSDSFYETKKLLPIHSLLKKSSEILKNIVPWCGRDRFKTYSRLFEDRALARRSVGYRRQEFLFFDRSGDWVPM